MENDQFGVYVLGAFWRTRLARIDGYRAWQESRISHRCPPRVRNRREGQACRWRVWRKPELKGKDKPQTMPITA